MEVETLCVHGDTPGAAQMAKAVRRRLVDAGVELVKAADVLARSNRAVAD